MIYLDVTSSCKSEQNTGMQRMTRRIFAELEQRVEVTPICWNRAGNVYQLLGVTERKLLTRPFEIRSRAVARPELRGQNPVAEFLRLMALPRFAIANELTSNDVFLVPDVFHDVRRKFLPTVLPRTPARTVAIFLDATSLRLPWLYANRGPRYRAYIESLAQCDLVICISEEAHNDLRDFWKRFGCAPTATCVEPLPGEFDNVARDTGAGSSRNLIVYVSSLDPRKNHLVLLRAADKLWSEGLAFELQLIGRSTGPFLNKVVVEVWKMRLRGRPIRWLRHVDDATLLRAYRDCRFTAYPSLMEGFGLPIAESLWHGKPCICGGNGALGEIARGGGCLIVDQTSEEALAGGMKRLLTDQECYRRLRDAARARTFRTWRDYIDNLLVHLHSVGPGKSVSAAASN